MLLASSHRTLWCCCRWSDFAVVCDLWCKLQLDLEDRPTLGGLPNYLGNILCFIQELTPIKPRGHGLFMDILRLSLPFLSQLGHSWPLNLMEGVHGWLLGVSTLIQI